MSLITPLLEAHKLAGGKLVDFSGWQLPVHYGSQIDEHRAVRDGAGMFDVSHMTIVDLVGESTQDWLRTLLSNDVAKLQHGQALYSCMCNETGGVIDDLIAYCLGDNRYRLIVNAATREKDLAWMKEHLPDDVELTTPANTALIAVQGPNAFEKAGSALKIVRGVGLEPGSIKRFHAQYDNEWFIGRTGYTGEDGVEIALPAGQAKALWDALLAAGVKPCGLGARDTLRLEAGMCLYGLDLDEAHSPIESGIGWSVDLRDETRQFIGRETLAEQMQFGGRYVRLGLQLDGRGVLRNGQTVQLVGKDIGTITSGTFSPTRQQSIAFARVNKSFHGHCDVMIRGKPMVAHAVPIPFVHKGVAKAEELST
ncbi:MAG: glycine cleavage system aminomethyltransferase GcvT [Granulosicoccus sp.]